MGEESPSESVWNMQVADIKFSIVVPVYNVEVCLRQSLDSIVRQTCTNWECICVDDGSFDGSGRILNEYARKDSRFRVIHSENEGVVAARRRGLDAAQGEWVWFVDGDDFVQDEALDAIAEIVKQYAPSLVKFNFDRVYGDGTQTPNSTVSSRVQFDRTGNLIKAARNSLIEIMGMCVGDKVYKREIAVRAMQKVGGVRIRHSEDGLFAVAALLESDAVASTGKVLYHYVQREGSALAQFNAQVVADKELFVESMSRIFRESKFYEKRLDDRMTARLAHQAILYVVTSLCNWPLSARQVFTVAKELRASGLILLARSEREGRRRRQLFVLCAYCPILILLQRLRMSLRSRLSGRG